MAAITGGNRVTITDAEGAKTFDVMDGAQGASGADGKDYVLTDTDKQEIAKTAAGLVDVPSVQPDWNQNDETQPDYVKNRPFYTGEPVETVLVEESTVGFEDGFSSFQSTFEATVGETYKVYWDGAAYECICVDFRGRLAMGNLSIMGAGSNTGEPFFAVVNNGVGIDMVTTDSSASHTLSISDTVAQVVKIDEKYLPTIPADKLPTIPADKLPAIPVIEFTTSIAANIANDTQPSFTVSNLSYSEIYALVEKGNFQIKDSVGSNYRPIRCEIGSSGSIFVDILAFNLLGTVYANLACHADQTMFYRNRWWQIEATKK